jgi:cell division protein FtsI (penicillin-binding protein 3)
MKMMQTVTEPGGTATQAAILGYHVAGKTGTSRMAENGGYSRKYVAFFAGVVPVDNPRFAMAVVVNNPTQGSYYGGLVAGPVFHNVMEGALRLMDVPPDDIDAWLAAQAAAEAKARRESAPTFANVTAAPAPVDDEPGNDDARAVMP